MKMNMKAVIQILTCVSLCSGFLTKKDISDLSTPIDEMISREGYPVEKHTVETDDGYLLGVYRIPHGKKDTTTGNRPAVYMLHGLYSTGADWVMLGPKRSLAYILVEEGYDVWIGNNRGNRYSQKHVKLDVEDEDFWKFTVDEVALKDNPACIDYILNATGHSKIAYIGHSMGTVTLFAMLSAKTDYNDKINVAALLAPSALYNFTSAPIFAVSDLAGFITPITEIVGVRGKVGSINNKVTLTLIHEVCSKNLIFTTAVCLPAYWTLFGYDCHVEPSTISEIVSHIGGTTSSYQIIHFSQFKKYHRLQMYDFGEEKNIEKYNSSTPPQYDIKRISAPIGLFSSLGDEFADPDDVEYAHQTLPNVATNYMVPSSCYTHTSFIYGYDSNKILYPKIVTLLNKFKSN